MKTVSSCKLELWKDVLVAREPSALSTPCVKQSSRADPLPRGESSKGPALEASRLAVLSSKMTERKMSRAGKREAAGHCRSFSSRSTSSLPKFVLPETAALALQRPIVNVGPCLPIQVP